MKKLLALVALFLCSFNSALGLYFVLPSQGKKCFTQGLPEDTLSIIEWRVELDQLTGSLPDQTIEVRILDPLKNIFRVRTRNEERLTFTTDIEGEYVMCIRRTDGFFGPQIRVFFDIKTGARADDYARAARRNGFSELELRVYQLLNQAEQISKEQAYHRRRVLQIQSLNASTKWRVVWWILAQVAIVVSLGLLLKMSIKWFCRTTDESNKVVLTVRTSLKFENDDEKREFMNALGSYETMTIDGETKIYHKAISGHFENELGELLMAFSVAFGTEEFSVLVYPEGLKSLLALMAANSQGITPSPLVEWIAKFADPTQPSEPEQKSDSEAYIDDSYKSDGTTTNSISESLAYGISVLKAKSCMGLRRNTQIPPYLNATVIMKATNRSQPQDEVFISFFDDRQVKEHQSPQKKIVREDETTGLLSRGQC